MIADKFRLDGKVAVVTGGGKGIGQGIGLTFAEAGANVVFAARTQADVDASAERAKSFGVKAMGVSADVNETPQLEELVQKTLAAFGRIDIVVNNAGGSQPRPIEKSRRDAFLKAFNFNVASALDLTRICLPQLRESKGCVINVASAAGRLVQPNFAIYGTVKAAVIHMTKLMAAELAPDVRVNAVAPGSIRTDALNAFLPPDLLKAMCDLTPMKRLGEVEDIAMGALYLASPAAGWVTGKILEIDGGTEKTNMPY